MQAKTADAKLFTSALGACSAGSCWAQASWSGVFFFRKIDPYPWDERYTYQYLPWKIEQSNNSTRGKLNLAHEI